MATLAQMVTAVQVKLGLDTTSGGTEESQLILWLSQGVVDVLLRARVNVNTTTMSLSAGTADYTLDTGILALQDISYTTAAGTTGTLTRVTPEDILRFRSTTPASGATVRYYALNGNDMFMVYPTPSSADTLTIYYVPRPTALSSTSSTAHDPSSETYGGIPTEYHKAIELYALAQAAEFTDHRPSQYGARYRAEYEAKLVEIKRAMRHKGGRSLGPAIVGKRRPLVGDNSQYPAA